MRGNFVWPVLHNLFACINRRLLTYQKKLSKACAADFVGNARTALAIFGMHKLKNTTNKKACTEYDCDQSPAPV